MPKKGSLQYELTKRAGILLIALANGLIHLFDGRKVFWDPDHFPFTKDLEADWHLIREECETVLTQQSVPNIQDIFEEQAAITEGENWKSFMFRLYGYDFESNRTLCPETSRLLKKIPGMSSAMFSILAPGKRLLPHKGPYAGVIRYHLGLLIPDDPAACSITVNGIRKHWYPGKSMIFDDSFLHEARNDSGQIRVILFVDMIRELPFPLHSLNQAILRLIARSPFIQNVLKESERIADAGIKKSPAFMR
jgi:beta-hydroxylase